MPNRAAYRPHLAHLAHLGPATRIFWLFLTLGCGALPSLLFFVWVERNMALPGAVYQKLDFPWVSLLEMPLAAKLAWDFALFAAFGFFHSFLAQPAPQALLKKIIPLQCIRPFYLCITGLSVLLMMGAWQSTGIIVWLIPWPGLSFGALSVVSLVIYWGLMLVSMRVVSFFDPLEFIGLRQIYSRPEQIEQMSAGGALLTSGLYGRMRHPMYFFTLAAFLLAPMMSLDRLLFFVACVIYLVIGIPIEERKLNARFGGAYAEYRKQVPAVIPLFGRRTR